MEGEMLTHSFRVLAFGRVGGCLLLLVSVAASNLVRAAALPSLSPPATVEDAERLLDLRTFALTAGAGLPLERGPACLVYQAKTDVGTAFDFQKQSLAAAGWTELDDRVVLDNVATATYTRDGFYVSVSVRSDPSSDKVTISLIHRANVDIARLPSPPHAQIINANATSARYATRASIDEVRESVEKSLTTRGWQPYGELDDTSFFKKNAIRLAVRIGSAPDQADRTLVTYTPELMSVELPAMPGASKVGYFDADRQLSFEFSGTVDELIAFYRRELKKYGWKAASDRPNVIGDQPSGNQLGFRNGRGELLELRMRTAKGTTEVELQQRPGEKLAAAEAPRAETAATAKPVSDSSAKKVEIPLPANAREIDESDASIEFEVPGGQGKTVVASLRKYFQGMGWKEESAAVGGGSGNVTFVGDGGMIILVYADTGGLPAKISVGGIGVQLVRKLRSSK
jgi:hypothetical protein